MKDNILNEMERVKVDFLVAFNSILLQLSFSILWLVIGLEWKDESQ